MIKIQGNQYPSDFEAKKTMADAAKQMAAKGYGVASDGSLSVRVGPNAVWVTADDAQKGNLTQDMIVKVDLDGKPMLGARGKMLPEEMKIHLKIYRDHPEIRAVVHGYPPAAVAMGLKGMGIVSAGFTKTLRKLGDVPVVPYTGGDQDALAVSGCATGNRGVLLQKNGCMAWGASPAEALSMLEAMEYYAAVMSAAGQCREVAVDIPCESGVTVRSQEEGLPFPKLNGVTGLIRPGDRPGMRTEKPVISGKTSDVIHSMDDAGRQTGAGQIPDLSGVPTASVVPSATASPVSYPAPAVPKKVTEKPKEDVMAEVVRRTMQGFQL